MVNIEQIKQGFRIYYKENLMPMSWTMSLAEPIVMQVVNNFEKKYASIIDLMKDDNGCIDITTLHQEYRKKIEAKGYIEMAGLRFNSSDLDKLVDCIRKQEVTE